MPDQNAITKMAISLYEGCLDMDFRDYIETIENDILFLKQKIELIGFEATKKWLFEEGFAA